MENIPKDATAYMLQATTEIAKETGFSPRSESDLGIWMVANRVAICERAKELQWALLAKLLRHDVKERVGKLMADTVWHGVRQQEINRHATAAISEALA